MAAKNDLTQLDLASATDSSTSQSVTCKESMIQLPWLISKQLTFLTRKRFSLYCQICQYFQSFLWGGGQGLHTPCVDKT